MEKEQDEWVQQNEKWSIQNLTQKMFRQYSSRSSDTRQNVIKIKFPFSRKKIIPNIIQKLITTKHLVKTYL